MLASAAWRSTSRVPQRRPPSFRSCGNYIIILVLSQATAGSRRAYVTDVRVWTDM